jgi:hypothetical protein
MTVLFDTKSVHFPALKGNDASQILEFTFPGTINKASAMVSGARWGSPTASIPFSAKRSLRIS